VLGNYVRDLSRFLILFFRTLIKNFYKILELSDFIGRALEFVVQTCFLIGSKTFLSQAVIQSRSIEVELVFQLIDFGGLPVDNVEAVLD
jgi:hypothetical protein